jgi:Type I site-specific restriction-modification system, R (restriction) subunit and related helicases
MRDNVLTMTNQNPEQIARDNIDKQLTESGWIIQKRSRLIYLPGLVWLLRSIKPKSAPPIMFYLLMASRLA